jgi:hypothetical protein
MPFDFGQDEERRGPAQTRMLDRVGHDAAP